MIQIAKAEGLTVIADASKADQALIKSLGADIVVGGAMTSPPRSASILPMASMALPMGQSRRNWSFQRSARAAPSPRCGVTRAKRNAASRSTTPGCAPTTENTKNSTVYVNS